MSHDAVMHGLCQLHHFAFLKNSNLNFCCDFAQHLQAKCLRVILVKMLMFSFLNCKISYDFDAKFNNHICFIKCFSMQMSKNSTWSPMKNEIHLMSKFEKHEAEHKHFENDGSCVQCCCATMTVDANFAFSMCDDALMQTNLLHIFKIVSGQNLSTETASMMGPVKSIARRDTSSTIVR